MKRTSLSSISSRLLFLVSGLSTLLTAGAARVVSLPMDVEGTTLRGQGVTLSIEGRFKPMQIAGAEGSAWRTDGNSSRATGNMNKVIDGQNMTATMRFAIDTYAIVEHENPGANDRFVEVVSCLDTDAQTGFGLFMNRTGHYRVKVFVGSELIESDIAEIIPLWEWTEVALVVDGRDVRVYRDGALKWSGSAAAPGVKAGGTTLYLGRANASGNLGGTETCAFNGAFDDFAVYDEVIVPAFSSRYADLNLPPDRYASDRMRARYHGQPGMNWTNETHGLFYNADGDRKWHAFFQRTGSTPMMSHQHWGHIVSDDLITWRDDTPVLAPSEPYDIKGCWSGCVFADPSFNGGKPTIIYTGVDYARPYAAVAYCDDPQHLRKWHKDAANPINVTGDIGDGRDTYFYRDGDNAYFLIGAPDAVHYYQWNGSGWKYKGEFYHTEPGVDNGHNTEMPNVTRFGDKWLMTTSPLAGQYGTACLYRTGVLNDGRFADYSAAERVDFFGCDGYGLLSPSPFTTADGRVYAIGIVPDKLPGELNVKHGYAHLYSLPREWSLDAEGRLLQKPYEGITAYRHPSLVKSESGLTLDGTLNLHPVRGREAEVCARFILSDSRVGLNFFKNEKGKTAYISYNPATQEIKIDYSQIAHYNNGRSGFTSVLPLGPRQGEELKLHVFIDHSIVDIFVNDRYAASVRVFPEDDRADLMELFADGATRLEEVEAYVLGEGDMSDEPVVPRVFTLPENSGKVAFLKSSLSVSEQEKAACDFFTGKLKNNNVVLTSEPGRINVENFDCVWIHIDRIGLPKGAENLPAEFISADLATALKTFVAAGGNVYISGQATQMAEVLERLPHKFAPNEYNAGEGNDGADEWTVNPMLMDGRYDRSAHTLFSNLEESDAYGWLTYGILLGNGGPIRREDHNCMWKLNDFEYISTGEDNIARFEADNAARVLGTWGQESTDGWAGIVEFYPVPVDEENDIWSGTVLANGLAACQWNVTGNGNADFENLQLLTANAFVYLASKDGIRPDNPKIIGVTEPEEPPVGPVDPVEPGETLESTGRVALYMGYVSSEDFNNQDHQYYTQDHLIYDSFKESYPAGTMLYSGDTDKVNVTNYDCIWVHCDRKYIERGWTNLPQTFKDFVEPLKAFAAAGGNLYFTKMASQLVVALGRTADEPTEFSNGDGGFNPDDWHLNIAHHNGADWSDHMVFKGLEMLETDYGKLIRINGGGYVREDHNCMWGLNAYGGHDSFCTRNNARVLGTWGHNGGQEFAGMIEFLPSHGADAPLRATSEEQIAARRGTIITNGVSGVEYNAQNEALANVRRLTGNVLAYLSPVKAVTTSVDETGEEMNDLELYTLSGMRVTGTPGPGLYVGRRGAKTVKILIR